MLKKYFTFLPIILILYLLSACESENITQINQESDTSNVIGQLEFTENFISEDIAIVAAENFSEKFNFEFYKMLKNEPAKNKDNSSKKVDNILSLKDDENKPALYLINYKGGGFTIIPADNRINPILAYSDTKKMPTNMEESLPGGLEIWLKLYLANVDSLRNEKRKSNNKIHSGWEILLSSEQTTFMKNPDPDPPCEDEVYETGPLLQTEWGQGDGYNNSLAYNNCSTTVNGKVLTGCVATALAQVMRYHEYPTNYNWSSMPNGPISASSQPSGTNNIAQLMYDAGDAVNMNWNCNFSGALGSDMEPAMENDFNYSTSTNYENYDMWDLKDDIDLSSPDRPAVVTAFDSQYGGHAWVADGTRMYYIYNSECIASGYLSFHMNWGWNGQYNGWFHDDDFSPGGYDFDTNIKQLVGIKP